MMQKGYLIERYATMPRAYTCNRLVEEAAHKQMQLTIIGIEDCIVTRQGVYTKKGEKLPPCDFTIRRYPSGITARLLSFLAPYNYNTTAEFERYHNRYFQLHELLNSTIPMPNFLLGSNLTFPFLQNNLGLPFVMKGLDCSQLTEVFLICQEADYQEAMRFFPLTKEWLFQSYIEESHGQDIRAYVIRGKVIACIKRTTQTNTQKPTVFETISTPISFGTISTPFEATPEIMELATKLYQRYRLDFFGLDLLISSEQLLFCEINVMAGIQNLEQVTGVNIAAAMIQTIQSDFN